MKDIVFNDGKIQIAESDVSHQEVLLIQNKGDDKFHPTVGVNITDYLNDDTPQDLLKAVDKAFKKDGMRVMSIGVKQGNLKVKASY